MSDEPHQRRPALPASADRIWTGSFVALLLVNLLLCLGFYMLPATLLAALVN